MTSPPASRTSPSNGHFKTADIDLATAIFASGIRPLETVDHDGNGMHAIFTFPRSQADLQNLIDHYSNYRLQIEVHRFSQCRRSLLRLAHGGRL
ncbi:MAG: DUF5659 domain-containing protein [Dehalococcoidia bacterium]